MNFRWLAYSGLAFFLVASRVEAFGSGDDSGAAGFKSLFLVATSRSAALGGADCALSANPLAAAGNPSASGGIASRTAGIAVTDYVLDVLPVVAYGAYPARHGVWSVVLGNVSFGEFQRTNETAAEVGTFGANDLSLRVGWAGPLRLGIIGGVSLGWIRSTIDAYSASALVMNVGLQWHAPNQQTVVAVSAENLGGALSSYVGGSQGLKDDVPTEFHAGVSHRPVHFPLPLLLVSDFTLPRDNEVSASVGAEIRPFEPLFIRVGYASLVRYRSSTDGDGTHKSGFAFDDRHGSAFGGSGLAAGFGVVHKSLSLDYAYSLAGAFGGVHRVAAAWAW
ncbi:MAG TPA: PorV/PorQ family protein [Candidatus Latescibacteria bacterium]|nr:PorV/PorQ family protein [Candidatus Latescibacterota bacterium]